MSYQSIIIRGEKIAENEYKLITEHGYEYHYICVSEKEGFLEETDETWKASVLEGEQILLKFLENPEGESPAHIYWNYEGRAMLEVKLEAMFRAEIYPFELKDSEEWPVDKNCPIPEIKKSYR
jgi:hypothetical protein